MKPHRPQLRVESTHPPEDVRSLKVALEYLYLSAMRTDLKLTAHLIGAAVESIADGVTSAPTSHVNGDQLKIGK